MIREETREVIQYATVCVGTYCDECKKLIVSLNDDDGFCFYHVRTHHSDWGNDSVDSVSSFDFCSMDCLRSHMEEYFENACGSEEYEISRKQRTRDVGVVFNERYPG